MFSSFATSSSSSTSPKHPEGCQCTPCTAAALNDPVLIGDSVAKSMVLSSRIRSLLHGTHGKGGKSYKGLRPIRARLMSNLQTINSSAATALITNVSVALNSGTFPELSSFNVVYDECRVLGVKVHFYDYVSVAASVLPAVSVGAAAIGFDPSAGAPSGPQFILQESYSLGPYIIAGIGGLAMSPSFAQFRTVSAKPPAALAPITSSDCPGSAWFCLDGGTAPIVFQFQQYCTALGTTGQVTSYEMYELDCEFKLRT